MPAKKKYKVGLEIEAWCTKCKVDRIHVIETLKSDGNINRVLCRTCESIHLFRRPKGEGGTGKAKKTTRRKKAESIVTEAEAAKAKDYAMDGEYAVGDVLKHAKFGLGKVTALKPGGKMEVSFDDSVRILLRKDTGSLMLKRGRAAAAARTAAALAKEESSKDEEEDDEADDSDDGDDADDDAGDDAAVVDDADGDDGDDEEE